MISAVLISVFCSLFTAVGVNYGIQKLHFHKLKQEMLKQKWKELDQLEAEAMNRWKVSPEDMRKTVWLKRSKNYKILKPCFTPTVPPTPIITSPQERNRKTHQL